jgi:hypothetical protein
MALALALAIAMGYGTRYDENEQTQRLKRGVCVSKRGLLVQGLRSTSSVSEVGRVRVGFGFVFGLCWCILRRGRSTTMLGNLLALLGTPLICISASPKDKLYPGQYLVIGIETCAASTTKSRSSNYCDK